jgi:hypothetical protein
VATPQQAMIRENEAVGPDVNRQSRFPAENGTGSE